MPEDDGEKRGASLNANPEHTIALDNTVHHVKAGEYAAKDSICSIKMWLACMTEVILAATGIRPRRGETKAPAFVPLARKAFPKRESGATAAIPSGITVLYYEVRYHAMEYGVLVKPLSRQTNKRLDDQRRLTPEELERDHTVIRLNHRDRLATGGGPPLTNHPLIRRERSGNDRIGGSTSRRARYRIARRHQTLANGADDGIRIRTRTFGEQAHLSHKAWGAGGKTLQCRRADPRIRVGHKGFRRADPFNVGVSGAMLECGHSIPPITVLLPRCDFGIEHGQREPAYLYQHHAPNREQRIGIPRAAPPERIAAEHHGEAIGGNDANVGNGVRQSDLYVGKR